MDAGYDFIVVGAGAAGCRLTEMLTRSGRFNVALIEAGDQEATELVQDHDKWFLAANSPEIGWKLKTVPQVGCAGRVLAPEVGRLLGGSSSHNAQFYVRCNQNEWDLWEKEGCDGWNRKSFLAAFRSYEKYEKDTEYHSASGFLEIRPSKSDDFVECMKKAAQESGIPWTDDSNAERQLGLGYVWNNVYPDYKRCGSWQAFIKPNLGRPNLKVISGAQVSHVLFENINGKTTAVGVEYFKNENFEAKIELTAKKEVILCGGAILTPQILLLSGIGNEVALRELGIPVVQHLPAVGQNLSDHLFAPMWYKTKKEKLSKPEWSPVQGFGRCDQNYDNSLIPDYQYHLYHERNGYLDFLKLQEPI